MKFKAFVTDNGVNLLEKKFLAAFDKMGRTCYVFLTKEHVFFVHNLLNGDGVQCIAQFRKDVFDDYRLSSQNEDRIAFSLDVSLRVSICTEFSGGLASNRLQIKLVKKLPPNCTQPMPFLTFETKGYKSAVIQDVPISTLNHHCLKSNVEIEKTLKNKHNQNQNQILAKEKKKKN